MGARLLADYLTSPLTSVELIAERSAAVEELVRDSGLRSELRELLGEGYDLERLAARVATARATPRDLAALARTLALLPKVKARLDGPAIGPSGSSKRRWSSAPRSGRPSRPPSSTTRRWPSRRGPDPTGLPLRARPFAVGLEGWQRLDCPVPGRAGPPYRHSGPQGWLQQVFGYYIEITHAQAQRVEIPSDYIRKQTVKNAERYSRPSSRNLRTRFQRRRAGKPLEYELFTALRDRVSADAPRLIQAGSVLAQTRRPGRAGRARPHATATAGPS